MNQAETISKYQPLLYSIAIKMIGRAEDAEDLVNDTFLNWLKLNPTKISNTKAYLIRSITNACHNHIKGLGRKKEELFDHLKHSKFVGLIETEIRDMDIKSELVQAFQVVTRKLEPVERVVFTLREAFNFDYSVLADLINKRDDNCRQIYSRALQKLQDEKLNNKDETFVIPELLQKFENACDLGELRQFIEVLKKDISESVLRR